MDTVSYSYATQNAPCAAFSAYYALRKIYGSDEDAFNTAMLNQLDCVFNATPPVSGLLLGAGLAVEDRGHLGGMADGKVGDGKIFIRDMADAVRIRTGERGIEAL